MSVVIWSKNSCTYCEQAKNLMKQRGIAYEERNISTGQWTREQLLEAAPSARTVPQIFINDVLIGGFDAFKKYVEESNDHL